MREERMRELMQQELAVPEKVHDAFEKGIQQVVHMDMEQAGTEQKTGGKGRQGFWHRAGLVAAAVAAVCIIGFHSQIYSFAKSLFIHDTVTVGKKRVASEADMEIIKIKDGVLSDVGKEYYFESMKDLGEKLGVSFLKSSEENDVTGEGRVTAVMDNDGEITVNDLYFSVNGVSKIEYSELGVASCHIESDNAYTISCEAQFYTKQFQENFGTARYASVIEEYETANGLYATILQQSDTHQLSAIIYCDNIRYEYLTDDKGGSAYTLADFEEFLDTLTK